MREKEREKWIDRIGSVVDLILSVSRWTEPEEGGLSFSFFPIPWKGKTELLRDLPTTGWKKLLIEACDDDGKQKRSTSSQAR